MAANGAMYFLLFVTVFVISSNFFVIQVVGQSKKVIVQTNSGFVRGEVLDGNFYRFRKIPYAEPPVGDLRFEVSNSVTF